MRFDFREPCRSAHADLSLARVLAPRLPPLCCSTAAAAAPGAPLVAGCVPKSLLAWVPQWCWLGAPSRSWRPPWLASSEPAAGIARVWHRRPAGAASWERVVHSRAAAAAAVHVRSQLNEWDCTRLQFHGMNRAWSSSAAGCQSVATRSCSAGRSTLIQMWWRGL